MRLHLVNCVTATVSFGVVVFNLIKNPSTFLWVCALMTIPCLIIVFFSAYQLEKLRKEETNE